MEEFYCKICNKNIEIGKGEALRCPICRYFLTTTKKNPLEILKRKLDLTTYCEHCEKMVLGIPNEHLIEALKQRTIFEINNLIIRQNENNIDNNSTNKEAIIINNLRKKLKIAIHQLIQTKKEYHYVCNICYEGVHLNVKPPLYVLYCPFCKKNIDDNSIYCKFCGSKINGKSRSIPPEVKKKVWTRDQGCCVICGKKEDLEYDHIIPYSRGGANSFENIQILCSRCNKKKYNKLSG